LSVYYIVFEVKLTVSINVAWNDNSSQGCPCCRAKHEKNGRFRPFSQTFFNDFM